MIESTNKILLIYSFFYPKAKIPTRATSKSSGLDLYALNETIIKSKSLEIINTGLKCVIPDGYEGQIRSRSGLASKNKIFVLNSPGTIDNDYRGEFNIHLINPTQETVIVELGQKIVQWIVRKVYLPEDEWIHLWTQKEYKGGTYEFDAPYGQIPVFVRKNAQSSVLQDLLREI